PAWRIRSSPGGRRSSCCPGARATRTTSPTTRGRGRSRCADWASASGPSRWTTGTASHSGGHWPPRPPPRLRLGQGRRGQDDRRRRAGPGRRAPRAADRKSTRLNSSHLVISYAVFCLKKKKKKKQKQNVVKK